MPLQYFVMLKGILMNDVKCERLFSTNSRSRRRLVPALVLMLVLVAFALAGCGGSGSGLEDGEYTVDVTTDSNMFHINEANEGKGLLTVKDGEMTVHVSLASKKIVNLFPGTKEEAQAEGADLIEPTKDRIVYDDGIEMEVYGFDIPVPALDEEIPVAIIGTHDNWYDHTITVSNPVEGNSVPGIAGNEGNDGSDGGTAGNENDADNKTNDPDTAGEEVLENAELDSLREGEYKVRLTMEGGTGRAEVESPAELDIEDGKATLTVVWSSPDYDYMIVDGEKYEPVNSAGNSIFEIPLKTLGEPFDVVADTTAMSKPHEIEYKFTCKLLK